MLVVLGGRADQGGAADVDVLHGVGEARAGPGDRGLEGIKIHDHQVDRRKPLVLEGGQVVRDVAASEDSGMDLGMQCLDPAAQDLGLAGVVGDFRHRDTGGDERRPGAAAGQKLGAAWARTRASSISPVFSKTLNSARRIGTMSRSWLPVTGNGSFSPSLPAAGFFSLSLSPGAFSLSPGAFSLSSSAGLSFCRPPALHVRVYPTSVLGSAAGVGGRRILDPLGWNVAERRSLGVSERTRLSLAGFSQTDDHSRTGWRNTAGR